MPARRAWMPVRLRIAAALTAATTGMALVPAATATGAAAVPGGTLTDGLPVTATVSAPGQDLLYTFAAVAGRHVTIDVSAAAWKLGAGPGTAQLTVLDDRGRATGAAALLLGGATFVDLTPTTTGTWSVLVDPVGAAVGSATFTLAADLGPTPLTSMTAATATLPFRGQRAVFTFPARAGRHVTFDVPATSWRAGHSVGTAHLTCWTRPAGPPPRRCCSGPPGPSSTSHRPARGPGRCSSTRRRQPPGAHGSSTPPTSPPGPSPRVSR